MPDEKDQFLPLSVRRRLEEEIRGGVERVLVPWCEEGKRFVLAHPAQVPDYLSWEGAFEYIEALRQQSAPVGETVPVLKSIREPLDRSFGDRLEGQVARLLEVVERALECFLEDRSGSDVLDEGRAHVVDEGERGRRADVDADAVGSVIHVNHRPLCADEVLGEHLLENEGGECVELSSERGCDQLRCAHRCSSSVGGDGVSGGDPAPSMVGASEPTEEVDAAVVGGACRGRRRSWDPCCCGGCRPGAGEAAAPASGPGAADGAVSARSDGETKVFDYGVGPLDAHVVCTPDEDAAVLLEVDAEFASDPGALAARLRYLAGLLEWFDD